MFNVQTKYISATNTSGARVRASVFRQPQLPSAWKKSMSMPYNHALNADQNHFEILSRLLHHWDEMDTSDTNILKTGGQIGLYSPRRYDGIDIEGGYLWHPVTYEPRGESIHRQTNRDVA